MTNYMLQYRSSQRPKGPLISPGDLSVVVDTMLQGMGRYLRCCGIDVYILDNNEDHTMAAQVQRSHYACQCIIQYSVLRYGIVVCGMVCGVVWYCMDWCCGVCGMLWYGVCGKVGYGMV